VGRADVRFRGGLGDADFHGGERASVVGADRVWNVVRLEGPSFVWHYRGAPHVHVWVNVADDPSMKLNA
jgi:hypothetical protein